MGPYMAMGDRQLTRKGRPTVLGGSAEEGELDPLSLMQSRDGSNAVGRYMAGHEQDGLQPSTCR
jgi:hypothetical protein